MFYAGTNPQVTYHAQSQDLISWQKDKPLKPVIVPDSRWYISHDADVKDPYNELGWRDPYLLYDEKNQRYVMTITARLNQGPWHERGCVAWVISKDLKTWEVQPPLYAPFIGKNLEVSEIFQMDGRFYLFFCHGETNTTRYRIAERLEGPYHCPADDTLLPSRMYAPRSVTLGGNRYLVPWAADHVEGHDDYPPQWGGPGWAWGGVLGTPQKMRSLPDGRLGLFYPEIVDRLAGDELLNPNSLRDLITQRGEWAAETGGTSAVSFQGLARGMLPVRGRDFILSCAITIKRGVAAGLILRAGETGEAGYYLRLEPGMKNISLWRYPQPWVVSRPLASKYVADLYYGQAWTVKILLHRHILDAYVNDCHVVSQAVYDYKEGHFGVFAQDAEATFAALKAHVLEE
jgi:beta-fructofuranosidase